MKAPLRLVLVAFAAALALGAVGAASASAALPALFNASKEEVKSVKFTGSGQTVQLTWQKGAIMTCEKVSELNGEFINAKEVRKARVKIEGCISGGGTCGNEGKLSTKVTSELLKGTLGYINSSKHEVGLRLEAEAETEKENPITKKIEKVLGPWATKLYCAAYVEPRELTGRLIGALPSKVLAANHTLVYEQAEGVQKPAKFEGSLLEEQLRWVNESAKGEAGVKFAISGSPTLTFAKEVEVKG